MDDDVRLGRIPSCGRIRMVARQDPRPHRLPRGRRQGDGGVQRPHLRPQVPHRQHLDPPPGAGHVEFPPEHRAPPPLARTTRPSRRIWRRKTASIRDSDSDVEGNEFLNQTSEAKLARAIDIGEDEDEDEEEIPLGNRGRRRTAPSERREPIPRFRPRSRFVSHSCICINNRNPTRHALLAPPVSRPRHPPLLARSASLPRVRERLVSHPVRSEEHRVHHRSPRLAAAAPPSILPGDRPTVRTDRVARRTPRASPRWVLERTTPRPPHPPRRLPPRRLPGELRRRLDVEERRRVGTRADARERCCSRLCPRRWRRSRGCRRRRRGCLVWRPGLPRASQTPRRTRPLRHRHGDHLESARASRGLADVFVAGAVGGRFGGAHDLRGGSCLDGGALVGEHGEGGGDGSGATVSLKRISARLMGKTV